MNVDPTRKPRAAISAGAIRICRTDRGTIELAAKFTPVVVIQDDGPYSMEEVIMSLTPRCALELAGKMVRLATAAQQSRGWR